MCREMALLQWLSVSIHLLLLLLRILSSRCGNIFEGVSVGLVHALIAIVFVRTLCTYPKNNISLSRISGSAHKMNAGLGQLLALLRANDATNRCSVFVVVW